jgi:threonine dehydrogenase-like Zn-dependent dehydrogenase
MMQAIRMGAPGSTVVLFGVPAGDEVITVPHQALITRGQRLAGCTGTPFLFPRALELLSRREVCVEPLITHRCGLKSLGRSMALLERREEGAIKVLIQPSRQH